MVGFVASLLLCLGMKKTRITTHSCHLRHIAFLNQLVPPTQRSASHPPEGVPPPPTERRVPGSKRNQSTAPSIYLVACPRDASPRVEPRVHAHLWHHNFCASPVNPRIIVPSILSSTVAPLRTEDTYPHHDLTAPFYNHSIRANNPNNPSGCKSFPAISSTVAPCGLFSSTKGCKPFLLFHGP